MGMITLNNGTKLEARAYVINEMLMFDVDTETAKQVMEEVTTENLKNAVIDDDVFTDCVFESASLSQINKETNRVIINIHLRPKTEMEIIQQRLDEQDAALIELAEMIGG